MALGEKVYVLNGLSCVGCAGSGTSRGVGNSWGASRGVGNSWGASRGLGTCTARSVFSGEGKYPLQARESVVTRPVASAPPEVKKPAPYRGAYQTALDIAVMKNALSGLGSINSEWLGPLEPNELDRRTIAACSKWWPTSGTRQMSPGPCDKVDYTTPSEWKQFYVDGSIYKLYSKATDKVWVVPNKPTWLGKGLSWLIDNCELISTLAGHPEIAAGCAAGKVITGGGGGGGPPSEQSPKVIPEVTPDAIYDAPPPAGDVYTGQQYPMGAVARWNTSRNVYSIYVPVFYKKEAHIDVKKDASQVQKEIDQMTGNTRLKASSTPADFYATSVPGTLLTAPAEPEPAGYAVAMNIAPVQAPPVTAPAPTSSTAVPLVSIQTSAVTRMPVAAPTISPVKMTFSTAPSLRTGLMGFSGFRGRGLGFIVSAKVPPAGYTKAGEEKTLPPNTPLVGEEKDSNALAWGLGIGAGLLLVLKVLE